MVVDMKIGEAQELYRAQIRAYQEQKSAVSKKLEKTRSKMESTPDKADQYGEEAATLELTLNALNDKQKEYQDYLDQLADQYCAYWNAAVAEQQKDAAQEYGIEMGKLMAVARRIMKGAIVPPSDEKKLMEYSSELYQMAKNVGSMVQLEKREKYDSLWGDEEKKEYDDPQEVAENAEAGGAGPEIVDVADTMAAAAPAE